MVSSINSADSDNLQLLMAQMYQKINAANTDGSSGLSQSELSAINSGGNSTGDAFLQSLSAQFDSLDTNGNGELSSSEIFPNQSLSGPMGPPPGMIIGTDDNDADDSNALTGSVSATGNSSTASTGTTTSANSMGDLVASLMEKLLESLAQSFGQSGDSTNSDSTASNSGNSSTVDSSASSSGTSQSTGVSLDDLKSMDTSGHPHRAKFVNNLIDNFSKYDTNGDGSLSANEIQTAMQNDSSQQTSTAMSDGNNLFNAGSSFDNIKTFMDKLVSAYKDSGGLSNIASSLHIA